MKILTDISTPLYPVAIRPLIGTLVLAMCLGMVALSGCTLIKGAAVSTDLMRALSGIRAESSEWASLLKREYANAEKDDAYFDCIEKYVAVKSQSDRIIDSIILGLQQNSSATLTSYHATIRDAQAANTSFVDQVKVTLRERNKDVDSFAPQVMAFAGVVWSRLDGIRTTNKDAVINGLDREARLKPFAEVAGL